MDQETLSRDNALASISYSHGREVLREILKKGPCSRIHLSQTTGFSEVAVSRIVKKFIESGLLLEKRHTTTMTRRGRPSIDLCFSSNYYVAGIGIRGYEQWVEVRTFGGELIELKKFTCRDLFEPTKVLQKCYQELERLFTAKSLSKKRILHLGVLIVGVVDSGWVIRSENLGWRHFDIQYHMKQLTDIPISVETMLNGMNLQQQFEWSSEFESTLLVSVALGIGSSIIVEDRLVKGHSASAGQIGHQRARSSQRSCLCGRIGCLDTVASGRALLQTNTIVDDRKWHTTGGFISHFQKLSQEAQSRPELAMKFRDAGKELGFAVAAAIPIIDPERVAFTGFVIDDDLVFDGVMEELNWYKAGTSAQPIDVIRYQTSGEGAPSFFATLSLIMEKD